MRGAWLVALVLLLGGCSLPPAFQIASLVVDAFSFVASGKSVTDHGISIVAKKDCALLRAIKGDGICRERTPDVAVAASTPAPVEEEEGPVPEKTGETAVLAKAGPPSLSWPGSP